jgi:alpha-L-fucosidase 2
MRKNGLLILFCTVLLITSAQQPHRQRLWYDEPASSAATDTSNGWINDAEWLKALPLGNGSLGAMVFGDVNKERIQLNEKSLWSGSPDDNDNPAAFASLQKIRELLWEGKYTEAGALTEQTQVCKAPVQDRVTEPWCLSGATRH